MKRVLHLCLLLVVLCSLSFAGVNPREGDPAYQAEFNQAYWFSQPSAVRALQSVNDVEQRTSKARDLAVAGHKIDVQIMVYGWNPYLVMKLRTDYGFAWVPSALQPPVSIAPGLGAPGLVAYDPDNPPPGSIRVSTDIAAYPPFDPPRPPAPEPVVVDYVGPHSFGNMYSVLPGDPTKNGELVINDRGMFKKVIRETPFGYSAYYEKQ